MTDKHLMDDNRSHDEAGDEFKREHGEESEIAIAAASGKGRKAIVQGTHYLLQRSNPPIPATPHEMRPLLAEWESRDSDTAALDSGIGLSLGSKARAQTAFAMDFPLWKCLRKILWKTFGSAGLCSGSTGDFGSPSPGSNPGPAAN